MQPLWAPQVAALEGVRDAIAFGHRRILLCMPTGTGKTRVAVELVKDYAGRDQGVVVYTNRRLLLEQLSRVFGRSGVLHGVRAAGHRPSKDRLVQVSSVQTEHKRRARQSLHRAKLVLVDEAHLNAGASALELIRRHADDGAAVVGLTATPIDLAHAYDHLVVGGTTSDGRACGALVPAHHYGPDEPDLRHVGRLQLGEDLTEGQNRKAIMVTGIFGRVYSWWRKLNPDQKPTILFAPGVRESVWFAEQFENDGVAAAHIDGETVWIRGRSEQSGPEARADLIEQFRVGRIKVLTNRFIMREGIDMPFVEHGIFATVFGSLQSYLQAGGRFLRAHPGKTRAVIQDHGGNWWRLGSLNADRDWDMALTPAMVVGMRQERVRSKKDREPVRCPNCARILLTSVCPCGHVLDLWRKSRPVIQKDGTALELEGDIFKPRKTDSSTFGPGRWKKVYYRARNAGMTFSQAMALYAYENSWRWPDPAWPLMPIEEIDRFRKVCDVHPGRLVRGGEG